MEFFKVHYLLLFVDMLCMDGNIFSNFILFHLVTLYDMLFELLCLRNCPNCIRSYYVSFLEDCNNGLEQKKYFLHPFLYGLFVTQAFVFLFLANAFYMNTFYIYSFLIKNMTLKIIYHMILYDDLPTSNLSLYYRYHCIDEISHLGYGTPMPFWNVVFKNTRIKTYPSVCVPFLDFMMYPDKFGILSFYFPKVKLKFD